MSWYAEVTAVSGELDTAYQIKASWPAIGGEHPDFLIPKPAPVLVIPKVGDFVEIEEIPSRPDEYWWYGPNLLKDALPDEIGAAYPNASAMLSVRSNLFLLLSDAPNNSIATFQAGTGSSASIVSINLDGTIQVQNKAGSYVTIKPSGEVEIDSGGQTTKLGAGATRGAARLDDTTISSSAEDAGFWAYLTGLHGALNSWVPAPMDGGLALKTLLTAAFAAAPFQASMAGKIDSASGKVDVE